MYPSLRFRSTRARQHSIGNSIIRSPSHSGEWSHVREYIPSESIRDILWKKTIDSHMFALTREDESGFDIIVYRHDDQDGDDFFTPSYPISRRSSYEFTQELIEANAKRGKHRFYFYQWAWWMDSLTRRKPRNSLICILWWWYWQQYTPMIYHNDFLYLDIIHRFESDPDIPLFFGMSLSEKSYKKAWTEEKATLKKSIEKLGWSYLQIQTHEDIAEKLNFFFKYRS